MTSITLASPRASTNFKPFVYFGYAIIVCVFGGLGTWSAFAKLDSAVVAQGSVSVESNRKLIQHLEGGIVEAILVKEGQRVHPGDALIQLRPLQATATRDIQAANLDSALALEARLTAEITNLPEITFPAELLARGGLPKTMKVMQDQRALFKERRASLESQFRVYKSRIEQVRRQIAGLESVKSATLSQIDSLEIELKNATRLAREDLYPLNKLEDLKRRLDDLRGRQGQFEADIAKSEEVMGESTLQIAQLEQKFKEDVTQALRDARIQAAESTEKLSVANDVLSRVDIRSQNDGIVQNLRFHTLNGVVKPGETILEIVPINDTMNIHVRVAPLDINYVHTGLDAEVRFPGVKSRMTPMIRGTVTSVSADVLRDEGAKDPYYLAIVEVPQTSLPPQLKGRLSAGMPVEVIVSTGERTVADYLIGPLANAARRTMREQ